MIYGLDDYIDKTLSLTTTLTRIIDHYSECDNPEGGMWALRQTAECIQQFVVSTAVAI